jgi:hypothetical protein
MDRTDHVRAVPDRRDHGSREKLLSRVKGEFEEMPCLRLTQAQAQRLFGLRGDVCERVLATLVANETLRLDVDRRYRVYQDARVA